MTIIEGIESAFIPFGLLVISASVVCVIAYLYFLIKELWQKNRGGNT